MMKVTDEMVSRLLTWRLMETPTTTPVEPTNTHGTGYGCACVSRNAFACSEIRYGYRDQQERCDCLCHNWEDDDED